MKRGSVVCFGGLAKLCLAQFKLGSSGNTFLLEQFAVWMCSVLHVSGCKAEHYLHFLLSHLPPWILACMLRGQCTCLEFINTWNHVARWRTSRGLPCATSS